MQDTVIQVRVLVGGKYGGNSVYREISITCDEPEALRASALNIGDAVRCATYAAVREYLDNLKSAEVEQGEAVDE